MNNYRQQLSANAEDFDSIIDNMLTDYERLQSDNDRLRDELDQSIERLKALSRNAAIVSSSLNSGDFIPEFRYKNFEAAIKKVREHLKGAKLQDSNDSHPFNCGCFHCRPIV